MYYEMTVVIEGAQDDVITFPGDGEGMDDYVDILEAEANESGDHYQIYIDFHEHEENQGECYCNSYANDHHPEYEFNRPE